MLKNRETKQERSTQKDGGAAEKKNPVPTEAAANKQQSYLSEIKHPIVGIGSSAGGLDAYDLFFKEMSADAGVSFVLVPHLDPHHKTILPELIQKKTAMTVHQVEDNMKVEPNHVYIIPPNKNMVILNGSLQLLEMKHPHGGNLPIDTFFRSLAQDQKNHAIGIIFSGTGTDGTIGLRAIKEELGMVMAQDVESAQYDGMPRSAADTGMVDYILSPDRMPEQLLSYIRHAKKPVAGNIANEDDTVLNALQKIYLVLRTKTKHDFSLYKINTICRRIERRMHVHQIDNISDYVRYLQESDREIMVLFKELLIGVTNFFRDPEAFELLKDKYLPELLQDKTDDSPFRVWVPGCSSGEEVYSIAIILHECMEANKCHLNVQIFGTDIDEEAIEIARTGLYSENISADVTPARLDKYFNKEEKQYRIKKKIREMAVFAPQNIIKDPPFTKLDLLSCRNLLIYFGPELQKKVLPMFHYALKKNGILFLGSSETIGQAGNLFSLKNKKWKIALRKGVEQAPLNLDFPISMPIATPREENRKAPGKANVDILHLVKVLLQQSKLPACVIIDDRANIVYVHGKVGQFLEPPEGEPSNNLLDMARPGLKKGLLSAIQKMSRERHEIAVKGLQVSSNGGYVKTNLILRPIADHQTDYRGLMLVIFDQLGSSDNKEEISYPQKTKKSEELSHLEEELQFTRESLQTTIEELESSNEELKSTNEELQSTNEELQSTNEELETSKEELQSLNEESSTVNNELQSRIDELSKVNDDMKNLLASTQIATIFIDTDLSITRFTPNSTNIIPLTNQDAGRPLDHFATKLEDIKLTDYAKEVLDDLVPRDLQVNSVDGNKYRMRVLPYRTTNNVIDGVVFTFDDISALLEAQADSRLLATVVKNSYDAIIVQDLEGKIIAWNAGAARMYGWSADEALQMNISGIIPAHKREESAAMGREMLENDLKPFVTNRVTKSGAEIEVWVTVSKIVDESNKIIGIATTERDLAHIK